MMRALLPAILLALVMSIVVAVLATGRESGPTLALAVGLFVLQMLFAIGRTNAPFWGEAPSEDQDPATVTCVWRNTVLAALIYAWGATAMLAIYSMSNLVWRHWWQYGAGMGLIALAVLAYAFLLSGRGPLRAPKALDAMMGLTAAQGLATAVAFGYLVTSGKLLTPRGDWAANYIFAAGSFALAFLSLAAILTYRKLRRGA